jgi:hypothetical protein
MSREEAQRLWNAELAEARRSKAEFQARKALARQVLASLDGVGPRALRALAKGLELSGAPLSDLSGPMASWAEAVAGGLSDSVLTELELAGVLRRMALDPDALSLIARLRRQPGQPWVTLAGVLEEIRRLEGVDA